MLTFVDLTNIYPQKQGAALEQMVILGKTQHINLLNSVAPCQIIMTDVKPTAVFRTESPDHISTWKQFCKTELSAFHTLSLFR